MPDPRKALPVPSHILYIQPASQPASLKLLSAQRLHNSMEKKTTSNFNRWSSKVLYYAQYKIGILTFTFWHSPQHNTSKSQPFPRNSQLPIQLTLQWAVADFQKLLPQHRNWCTSSLTQSQWFTCSQIIQLFDMMHVTQLHTTRGKLAVRCTATWQRITVTGLELENNITVPQQEKKEI
jgi:hypothetical protein